MYDNCQEWYRHFAQFVMQTKEHDLLYPISKTRRPLKAPTLPPITWVPVNISAAVKVPGCQVDHSPPSSAKDKNGWSYTSTFPIRFHSVDIDNNIYIYIYIYKVK